VATRYLGIDLGAETLKLVELTRSDEGSLVWSRRLLLEHHKEPRALLLGTLDAWGWESVTGAAACGRLSRSLALPRVPEKQARGAGCRFLLPDLGPATLVTIGSHGFSVLELREGGLEVLRENSRCSQGTGNLLRQLVERFSLGIAQAATLVEEVTTPCPLSGRCPVILKTDLTHLANGGQPRERILAGLFDAVAENVEVLVKPRQCPPRLLLLGGVARSRRIRNHFEKFCAKHGLTLLPGDLEQLLFTDALGAALYAATEAASPRPSLAALAAGPGPGLLEVRPPLAASLDRVQRLTRPPFPEPGPTPAPLILGLDIGSTGSKAVLLQAATGEPVWQGYRGTLGNPVGAAQGLVEELLASPWGGHPIRRCGVTGSGREIVGSLLTSCFGSEQVFVLNEIAAHARGAVHYDPRVDTIFEIGGQDAKYIRLAQGRVVDAAMNEACSAGTGSFIEEQGRRFEGVTDVAGLGREALAADGAVSLGQHCSVFMAEILDEAVATGQERGPIIAGIYDSVVGNYLNRVKGNRPVGEVVFCQGMPFAGDALAAAVARQTGAEVIVPPDPGTVGALGIALLTLAARPLAEAPGEEASTSERLPLERFLAARVVTRDSFVCTSTKGCGTPGNHCRIERIRTEVAGQPGSFCWGGGCSLYDRGTGRQKLPDLTPDPFRARERWIDELIATRLPDRGRPRIALTDEFVLKGLFPFFATFLYRLGFDLTVQRQAGQALLKRGIEEANVPFCAPLQQYHGLISQLAESRPALLFLPMLRSLPRTAAEPRSVLCPVVQASPDLLRWDLGPEAPRLLSPVLDFGPGGVRSRELKESCRAICRELGLPTADEDWAPAYAAAAREQESFDRELLRLGQQALDFAQAQGLIPVVTLGRPYTLYNTVLNSNVPTILREQGVLPIPVDCYPIDEQVPVFTEVYWGYAQRSLRAAHQIRRTPGVYALWCSNYSCGPDSFGLHFFGYLMEGKPHAVIETDGHSGDAGTRTRVEAFLHCVREHRAAAPAATGPRPRRLRLIELDREGMGEVRRRRERVLVPRMGPGAESLAACLRGLGMPAEALPRPDREALALGRRHTSGKECVPLTITLGSLLQRLQRDEVDEELFAFFMPTAKGPCRFGVYNLLHKIVLERVGAKDRVRIWEPEDKDYFEGVPAGFAVLAMVGFAAEDLLAEALYHTRPAELRAGSAATVYAELEAALSSLLQQAAAGDLRLPRALREVATGRLFGVGPLLHEAGRRFAACCRPRVLPTVLVVGEIYVRLDPFANDFAIDRLQERGVRVRLAPFSEWLEYVEHENAVKNRGRSFDGWLSYQVQQEILRRGHRAIGEPLGWGPRTTVVQSVAAAGDYLRPELEGEAVLTVGGPVHEWRSGLIDGTLSLGPLECMPSKIAEAQLFHAAAREGLPSLTLALNGDPVDPALLDGFVFEVESGFRRRQAVSAGRGQGTVRPISGSLLQRLGFSLPEPPASLAALSGALWSSLGLRPGGTRRIGLGG